MGNLQEEPIQSAKEERKPLSRKLKLLSAAGIFYGNVAFGCAFNTYGPVVTSMQTKYETDDETISRVFTILTVGYMIGALSGGVIFNYVNRQMSVIALLSCQVAIMLLTPHLPTMTLLFVSAGAMGLVSGSYDCAQFVWMMEMMQKDCPPYVQAQHFFYALGTSFAGLIMAPFLDEEEDGDSSTTMKSFLHGTDNNTFNDNLVFAGESSTKSGVKSNKLFIPYTIVGGLLILGVAYHILLFIFVRYHPPPPEVFENSSSEVLPTKVDKLEKAEKTKNPLSLWSLPKLRMVVLACCFYGAYQGMEMCTFQFFPKFGQNSDLKLSESDSSYVLSGMTIAFAVGRGVATIAVFKISCQLLLCFNIVTVIIANIILVAWANSSLTALWACSIIYGIGFSSIYGSFGAYIERFLEFTNFMGGLVIVCGSGVASIYPIVVGKFIEENPIVLSYTSFFSIFFLIFSLSSLSYLTHKDKTRY